MRIMWRGLELPGRVVRDEEVSNEVYGRFTVEPFEQGFGTTIGNSLRRVLLSSLEGAAITHVRITGVSHEFSSIDGVLEDVTDILLNVKEIVVGYDGVESKTLFVQRDTVGEVRAGDIVTDPSVSILNTDHLIATLTASVPFRAEFIVRTGRGYATANDNRAAEQELGVIPVDSAFSPVRRVRFRTEAMRVGQRTNYDRLILEVWTNGTVLPEDAVVEAGQILRKHLTPFVMYYELGEETVAPAEPLSLEPVSSIDAAMEELLNKPISVLNLSVRAGNCLEAARVTTLRELVAHSESELLRFRSFGKTSLTEVAHKLADLGLTLGMKPGGNDSESELVPAPGGPIDQGGFGMPRSVPEPSGPGTEDSPGEGKASSGDAEDSPASPSSGPMAAFTMDD